MSAVSLAMWEFTDKTLEDHQDIVKVAILAALCREGLLTKEVADEWCATHTVKMEKKTLWRTLTDRWAKGDDGNRLQVVKLV
jgi:hypothetical protein